MLLLKCKSILCNIIINGRFHLQNNPKDLDPSYKTDLDLSDCYGREKHSFYNRQNTVNFCNCNVTLTARLLGELRR